MVKQRGRIEIERDVLRVLAKGIHAPTRIMSVSNLNWKSLMEIMEDLEGRGLVERFTEGGKLRFRITRMGMVALEGVSELIEAVHGRRGHQTLSY